MQPNARSVAIIAILAFLGLLIYALMTLGATQRAVRYEVGESRIWITAQAEREATQLLMSLSEALPPSEENDPAFRMDLLYSRIALLADGPQMAYFKGIGAGDLVTKAMALTDELDRMRPGRNLPAAELDEVRQKILEISALTRNLTNITSLRDRADRYALRESMSRAMHLVLIAVIGFFFAGALLAVLLLRNSWRLQVTQSELEHNRVVLEDTVAQRTRELRESLEVERRAKEVYNSFIVTISHQFRTPISIINMIAQRQLREPADVLPEPMRRRFSHILEAAVRLETILTGFLASAGTREEGAPLARRRVDFHSLAGAAIDKISHSHPGRRIDHKPAPGALSLIGDPVLLIQVIESVLSNAVRYSDANSIVTLSTSRDHGFIRCKISDQGIGIAPEAQKSVFQRFYRAQEVQHLPGAGLGLHFAKAILGQHGGAITFTSELGLGTSFTLSLPEAGDGDG